jgi:RNA polymerase sigma factor (sigma-70 family)
MYAGTLLDITMNHAETLVSEAQAGNKEAAGKLVSLWYKRIYNYSFKYFSDHDLASEVAQKTFIAMYRKMDSLVEISAFRPWLYRIATNYCHEEERARKRHTGQPLHAQGEAHASAHHLPEPHSALHPEREFQQRELAELLLQCLRDLPQEQREVVIMKEYEGLKFREIAEALDVSENTVKSRMYYGLDALRKAMKKRNITKETIDYE